MGRFKGFTLKPIVKNVQIPALVVMIIVGFILRNFAGKPVAAYPVFIASWVQSCILGIIALRGGMAL